MSETAQLGLPLVQPDSAEHATRPRPSRVSTG